MESFPFLRSAKDLLACSFCVLLFACGGGKPEPVAPPAPTGPTPGLPPPAAPVNVPNHPLVSTISPWRPGFPLLACYRQNGKQTRYALPVTKEWIACIRPEGEKDSSYFILVTTTPKSSLSRWTVERTEAIPGRDGWQIAWARTRDRHFITTLMREHQQKETAFAVSLEPELYSHIIIPGQDSAVTRKACQKRKEGLLDPNWADGPLVSMLSHQMFGVLNQPDNYEVWKPKVTWNPEPAPPEIASLKELRPFHGASAPGFIQHRGIASQLLRNPCFSGKFNGQAVAAVPLGGSLLYVTGTKPLEAKVGDQIHLTSADADLNGAPVIVADARRIDGTFYKPFEGGWFVKSSALQEPANLHGILNISNPVFVGLSPDGRLQFHQRLQGRYEQQVGGVVETHAGYRLYAGDEGTEYRENTLFLLNTSGRLHGFRGNLVDEIPHLEGPRNHYLFRPSQEIKEAVGEDLAAVKPAVKPTGSPLLQVGSKPGNNSRLQLEIAAVRPHSMDGMPIKWVRPFGEDQALVCTGNELAIQDADGSRQALGIDRRTIFDYTFHDGFQLDDNTLILAWQRSQPSLFGVGKFSLQERKFLFHKRVGSATNSRAALKARGKTPANNSNDTISLVRGKGPVFVSSLNGRDHVVFQTGEQGFNPLGTTRTAEDSLIRFLPKENLFVLKNAKPSAMIFSSMSAAPPQSSFKSLRPNSNSGPLVDSLKNAFEAPLGGLRPNQRALKLDGKDVTLFDADGTTPSHKLSLPYEPLLLDYAGTPLRLLISDGTEVSIFVDLDEHTSDLSGKTK